MSRILIPESEYKQLRTFRKQHHQQQRQQQQEQDRKQHLLTHDRQRAAIDQEAVDRDNEERREAVAPLQRPLQGVPGGGGQDEGLEAEEEALDAGRRGPPVPPTTVAHLQGQKRLPTLTDLADAFDSPDEWQQAMSFLHKAILCPSVHINRSCLYIDGLKIGNLVLVLHALFGNKDNKGVHNRKKLSNFAARLGFPALHSTRMKKEQKKKTSRKTVSTTWNREKKKKPEHISTPEVNSQVYSLLK